MPLPSLFQSSEKSEAWSVVHSAGYGAVIGALAALFKTLGPLRTASAGASLNSSAADIAVVACVFALLCAGAAALRTFLARRFIWHDGR
jgi:hypothetical protein